MLVQCLVYSCLPFLDNCGTAQKKRKTALARFSATKMISVSEFLMIIDSNAETRSIPVPTSNKRMLYFGLNVWNNPMKISMLATLKAE
ncbi:hypothetical protein A8990_11969 [Paenibacillus taihuensis]|uniref:Uncharacterized protein n=1 Tax=Paenibacillus taihuensis TaxID=1156355 RepID=A0A3D9RX24_9BACL|nr:hypothetical protein A8990_11969 [Paenibacillus taihuensis]